MELSILDTMNMKLRDSADDLKIRYELPAESSNVFYVRFSIKDITKVQQLRGSFSYTGVAADGSGASVNGNVEFKLAVLCSYFVEPERLGTQQFAQLIDEPANFAGKASGSVALGGRPTTNAFASVAKCVIMEECWEKWCIL